MCFGPPVHHVKTSDAVPPQIRASTPMFLMSRKIKALGVKMVLSGEGSDEVFGGYLYFHKAPNKVRQTAAMGPGCMRQPVRAAARYPRCRTAPQ